MNQYFLRSVPKGCPCGFLGDTSRRCTCTPPAIQRYMAKISGPLMDRIDIHIEVPAVHYRELSASYDGEKSAHIQERVQQARSRQEKRFEQVKGVFCNAHMNTKQIKAFCQLDNHSHSLLEMAMNRLGLSARAYNRILKVARTIADLSDVDEIRTEHVSEAIQYRSLDRELWLQQ